MAGYFSIERDFLSSDFWLSEPFTKPQAWVDLIGLANHKAGFTVIRGLRIEVDRGQTARSELTLAGRWLWSRNKVRAFLKLLSHLGNISQKKDNKTTIITICNYDLYQRNQKEKGTAEGTPKGTAEGQQKDSKRNTNNNVNNENKKNNKRFFVENSKEFQLAKYLESFILNNKPNSKKQNLQTWAKEFDLILRIDKRDISELRGIIEWCQKDSFWHSNILSPKKLRSQYDQLILRREEKKKPLNGKTNKTFMEIAQEMDPTFGNNNDIEVKDYEIT